MITQDTTPKKKKPTIKKINNDHVVVVRKRPKPKPVVAKKAKPTPVKKALAAPLTLREEIISTLPEKMPWKIGIAKEIEALMEQRHPDISKYKIKKTIEDTIRPRVRGYRYLQRMSCGGVRHGLNGEKTELAENHRKDAVREVRTMINRQKKYYQIKRMLNKKRKSSQQREVKK